MVSRPRGREHPSKACGDRGPMTRKSPLPSAPVLALLFASAALAPCPARAEDAVSPARELFVDARKLMADGRYAEACPKLEESLRLEVGVGTQFNLADCWEHIGRTASAHALFLGAAESAKAAGQSDREQVLRDRAAALEPRLSKLVIEVAATDKKLSIERDDLPLEQDSWGEAVAIDPGNHTIKARAPGKRSWERIVQVTAATTLTTVHVPELEPATPTKSEEAPVAGSRKPEAKARPLQAPALAATDVDAGPRVSYAAIAVAGIAAGALTVGTVMGLRYSNANSDAKDVCPSSHNCTLEEIQTHERLIDDAKTARAWSYAGFSVGAATLIGAGALWYLHKPRITAGVSWQAAPLVATDGCYGAALNGSF